ncbi:MAG: DRTGG domain-containing protein [Clostridia bacterium]
MINIAELCEILSAKQQNLVDANRNIVCGYAGDFLSFVIGKAPTDSAWFTVMNNINVCAVATLADVAVVVLCEGVKPDENLLAKAKLQNVNILSTDYDIYTAVKLVAKSL